LKRKSESRPRRTSSPQSRTRRNSPRSLALQPRFGAALLRELVIELRPELQPEIDPEIDRTPRRRTSPLRLGISALDTMLRTAKK